MAASCTDNFMENIVCDVGGFGVCFRLVPMLSFWILSDVFCLGKNRYTGKFSWRGPKVTGLCKPAKCDGKRLNGKPGEKCRCADGYAGEPSFNFRPLNISHVRSVQSFLHHGEFSDETCTPAECTIPNSIGQGLECRCADKFWGEIKWKGTLVSGKCVPAGCNFEHSNKKPGPDCACAFGYEEISPIVQTVNGLPYELFGVCHPIPCVGDSSNHQDGPGCRCADGYRGTIQHVTKVNFDVTKRSSAVDPARTVFKADCWVPAKCDVENTIGDGRECRCKDGYQGSVTWKGTSAFGACKPAHCSIDNSNRKPGPQCSCLDGYHGSILTDVGSHSSASLLDII